MVDEFGNMVVPNKAGERGMCAAAVVVHGFKDVVVPDHLDERCACAVGAGGSN